MAGSAAVNLVSNLKATLRSSAYALSPHAPRARSYSPPGTGFSSVSNVRGFCILLTERVLISAELKKEKSTLSIADGTG